ncbi:MAG TPA: hypothetical protein P5084_08650 [Paludibacter sp.]|nr:hypothetical protein [Paludibacter sp.]
MKKHRIIYLYTVCIIIAFQACNPKYVPNVINTPMFTEAGEVNVAVNFGESGFDPQLSASLTDHFGIMLNGSLSKQTDYSLNASSHRFLEFGAGYYTKSNTFARFEVYGGYGFGNFKAQHYFTPIYNDSPSYLIKSDVNCNRFFIQPGFGIITDYVELSLASRFVNVNYLSGPDSDNGLRGVPFFFVEPALTLKAGSKYIKGVLQVGTSLLLNYNYVGYEYDPFILSLGLQVKFDTFARKHRKPNYNPEFEETDLNSYNL